VDPDKATEIGELQTDGQRVKLLAARWLEKRGISVNVREGVAA
jgi:hypothetical protein